MEEKNDLDTDVSINEDIAEQSGESNNQSNIEWDNPTNDNISNDSSDNQTEKIANEASMSTEQSNIIPDIDCNNVSVIKNLKTSKIIRISNIFLTMTIACIVLGFITSIIGLAGPFITGLLYVVVLIFDLIAMFLIVVCSLGTVFLDEKSPLPKMWDFVANGGDIMENTTKIANISLSISKWVAIVGIVLTVISIILTACCRRNSKVVKLILLPLVIAIFVLMIIICGGIVWES